MLQGHSAILSTFIKLLFAIKTFVLSIFKAFKTSLECVQFSLLKCTAMPLTSMSIFCLYKLCYTG